MSWEVAQVAALECLEAYLEAIHRGDWEAANFWRDNTMQRIGNLNDALRNYHESGRADSTE
jgi:hypothetical protein